MLFFDNNNNKFSAQDIPGKMPSTLHDFYVVSLLQPSY